MDQVKKINCGHSQNVVCSFLKTKGSGYGEERRIGDTRGAEGGETG